MFYEYLRIGARAGREGGVESVVVSNGYIEAAPLEVLLPLLRAVKIDLKAFTQNFYGRVCDGELRLRWKRCGVCARWASGSKSWC